MPYVKASFILTMRNLKIRSIEKVSRYITFYINYEEFKGAKRQIGIN